MRKLVSIQRVKEISPIDGADAIELVHINGWQCVTKKGEFKIDDIGLYFEIDSFLPITPEFEFLRKSSFKKMGDQEGFRLKTMKLRGQLSQGLLLPVSLFPDLFEFVNGYWVNKVEDTALCTGDDVTSLLGVEKYEAPIPAEIAGDVVGPFPSFIPKTDEERIQNLPDIFDKFKDVVFEESLKLDGASMTVFRTFDTPNDKTQDIQGISGKFGVCMRNYELKQSSSNTLWKVALEYKLPEILSNENLEIAIQGELMGPGIQGNREKLNKHDFFIFRIWDIKNKRFYSTDERFNFIQLVEDKYSISLKHAPIINRQIKIFHEIISINDMLLRADGKSINHEIREGIVFKALIPDGDRSVGSVGSVDGENSKFSYISFKAINNNFLLKEKD